MKKLAAGNWKMNGNRAALAEVSALLAAHPAPACEMLLCPPATLLRRNGGFGDRLGARGRRAGLPCQGFGRAYRRYLGRDAGGCRGSHVILGHSERRADHGETDALVLAKAEAAIAAGLIAVVCLGETEAQRDAGETLAVIGAQLDGSVPAAATARQLVLAYEPVWAIGTGRTPTIAQIAEVHAFLRAAPDRAYRGARRPARACSMAVRSSPPTPPRSSRCRMSMALWSAGPA